MLAGARESYLLAARRTTSVPERNYLQSEGGPAGLSRECTPACAKFGGVDLTKASLLREMLTGTELGSRTTEFAHSLRRFTTRTGGLMLFGPADDEPWHLTAHLDDELHRAGVERHPPGSGPLVAATGRTAAPVDRPGPVA